MLTSTQEVNLMDIVALISERDMPSNNTEERLIERSGLDQKIVAWCIAVLFNEGEGWLEYDEHPHTGVRGYYLGEAFEMGGTLDHLFTQFQTRPSKVQGAEGDINLDEDDEDPDDEWADIDELDDDDTGWVDPS
jgi:hypothetical protein